MSSDDPLSAAAAAHAAEQQQSAAAEATAAEAAEEARRDAAKRSLVGEQEDAATRPLPPVPQQNAAPQGQVGAENPPGASAARENGGEEEETKKKPAAQRSVRDFLLRDVPPTERPSVEDVGLGVGGAVRLAEAGSWKTMVKQTLASLAAAQSYAPHEMYQLHLCHVMALLKTKQARAALTYLDKVELHGPGTRYEDHAEYGEERKGSMVPFTLRLAHAECPSRLGNPALAADRLYALLALCRKQLQLQRKTSIVHRRRLTAGRKSSIGIPAAVLDELSVAEDITLGEDEDGGEGADETVDEGEALENPSLWKMEEEEEAGGVSMLEQEHKGDTWSDRELRCCYHLANVHLVQKEYLVAADLLEYIARRSVPPPPAIFGKIGRVLLMGGDVGGGRAAFARAAAEVARRAADGDEDEATRRSHADMVEMHEGFLHIAQGDYASALTHFHTVAARSPDHLAAVNNLAICQLYTCALGDAVATLEDAVRRSPTTVNESLLFNLATLYDLGGGSANRRALLHDIVALYAPHDFDISVL